MKKSLQCNFHIKLIILVIVSPYVVLFGEIPESKHSSANLLDIRFKGLEKEKAALLQIMRPFASISFKFTAVWSRDLKMWNKGIIKNEFYWDRSNGNYRYIDAFQFEDENKRPMVQVGEITCWNQKSVDFGYNCPGTIETFQLPELGKIPFDNGSLVGIGKPNVYSDSPSSIFPNLQYRLNASSSFLIDILNSPKYMVKIKKIKNEEELMLRIIIGYDKAYPEREDLIFEFDLEKGVLRRRIVNLDIEGSKSLIKKLVIELDEFIDVKGWKIPMHSIHYKLGEKDKTIEAIRFMIDRSSFTLNEPIPSQVFMARIAQPVTIYDETLGITFKSSVIPDSTTDAIAAELDGLLGHELKSSKIKQQLK